MRKSLIGLALAGVMATAVGLAAIAPAVMAEAPDKTVKLSWEFENGDKGKWSASNGLKGFGVVDGALTAEVSKVDPNSMNTSLAGYKLDALDVPLIKVRMKSNGFQQLKFYFATVENPNLDEAKTASVNLEADNDWHEYTVEMDGNNNWEGLIKILRIDPEPAECVGATFSIDYIRLCER